MKNLKFVPLKLILYINSDCAISVCFFCFGSAGGAGCLLGNSFRSDEIKLTPFWG